MLEKADGMPCRKCGCQAQEWLGSRIFRGVVFDRWRCEHCGYEWMAADAKQMETNVLTALAAKERDQTVVFVNRLKCPIERCRSRRIQCYGTRTGIVGRGVVRYHRCLDCDYTFKSEERPDA